MIIVSLSLTQQKGDKRDQISYLKLNASLSEGTFDFPRLSHRSDKKHKEQRQQIFSRNNEEISGPPLTLTLLAISRNEGVKGHSQND